MEKFTQKVKAIIPENNPFAKPTGNDFMPPEKYIAKYGHTLEIKEIKDKFPELSKKEIKAILDKNRGVV
jgi:hypothetical protein